jgi:predicted regulator of Ras-like GTPase activity (Roadblock/LC7/MglB family)
MELTCTCTARAMHGCVVVWIKLNYFQAEVLSAITANMWASMDKPAQMGSGMESMVVELEDAGIAAVRIPDHLILVTCGPRNQLGLLKLKVCMCVCVCVCACM